MAQDYVRGAQIGLIAAVIAVLYFLLVAMLIISFSVYVIRTDFDLALSQSPDGPSDFDEVVFLIDREIELAGLVQGAKEEQTDLAAELLEIELLDLELVLRQENLDDSHASFLKIVRAHLMGAAYDLIDTENARMVTLLKGDSIDESTAITGLFLLDKGRYRTGLPDKRKVALAEDSAELRTELADLSSTRAELLRETGLQDAKRKHVEAQLSGVKASLDRHMKLWNDLLVTLPIHSEHRGRLRALDGIKANGADEPADAEPVPRRRIIGSLVRLPPILLTLMATIAAGALGTLVAYTRTRFVGAIEPKISELTIAMGEGVAAAIGVFLFAGAGLLALSQGGGESESLDLSPYMVAFLAFLSGLMAESAFGKITSYGNQLFGDK